MPGSPVVKKNLDDELARIGGIATKEGAQEFVDVVSGVKQFLPDVVIYNI